MARLRTIGWEIGLGSITLEGETVGAGTATIDTGTKRSGAKSLKVDSGAGNNAIYVQNTLTGVTGTTYYLRVYINQPTAFLSDVHIIRWVNAAGTAVLGFVLLDEFGTLALFDGLGNYISPQFDTVATNQWYCVELAVKINTGTNDDYLEMRVDGVSIASTTTANVGTSPPGYTHLGFPDVGPGANRSLFFDDLAINDSTGSNQTSWPGSGKVVLCKPISDNQRGSWTGGAGGTTNLWDAVDNTPPAGTATETDTTQIESTDSSGDNTTDEYRANLTTYTTAGIVAGDTMTLVQAVVDHGEDVSTGTKTGKVYFQANPAGAAPGSNDFNFGDDVGALGTWPSGWAVYWGVVSGSSVIYAPAPTLGSSPVLALRKTDSGTRVASCDFLGAYVEYMPAAGNAVPQAWTQYRRRRA